MTKTGTVNFQDCCRYHLSGAIDLLPVVVVLVTVVTVVLVVVSAVLDEPAVDVLLDEDLLSQARRAAVMAIASRSPRKSERRVRSGGGHRQHCQAGSLKRKVKEEKEEGRTYFFWLFFCSFC